MPLAITDSAPVNPQDLILVTGASGFIGRRVVQSLVQLGFKNIRCFTRSRVDLRNSLSHLDSTASIETFSGNLLSFDDCLAATSGASVIVHLAAGRGEKSFPDAFLNSVVTTRNLLEAARRDGALRRFVNISSFAVYTNQNKAKRGLLDETSPEEHSPTGRDDAYCFAKVRQDYIVREYGEKYGIPHVTIRPGYVYGPGKKAITGRVGVGTFGVFLHLGGGNNLPLTYVENCADAIAIAAVKSGADGEIFNIVDDDLPSSRRFLRLYKRHVRWFPSLYLPHWLSYVLCFIWERYSVWSEEQLPPVFNRAKWHAFWKRTRYTNSKAKSVLGWEPKVKTTDGLRQFFKYCGNGETNA